MRQISDADLTIITSPAAALRYRVDVMRGAERVLTDLTASSPVISWDLDGEIKQLADLDIVYSDDLAGSLVPRDFQALIGPWGNELTVSAEWSIDEQRATVPVGQLLVESIPSATDDSGLYRLHGRELVLGSVVSVRAVSLDERIARRGFGAERLAPVASTCWDELARLTGMKVARNVPDRPAPKLEYERAQRDRLRQAHALATRLGGTLVVDADGVLTVVPDVVGEPVGEIAATRVIDAPYSVSSEGIYNEVVGNYEDDDRNPISVPPARITAGPLAVTGPYGVYTRYHASEFVTTRAAAVSAQRSILEQVSRPSFDRTFTALLDPRVEIGDTWTVLARDGAVTGLVTRLEWGAGTMTGTIRHQEDIRA